MQIFGSGQSHVKIWFFEISKAIPVSIWNEFTSKNVAKEALGRSRLILDTDHWSSSKSRQNTIFWNVNAIHVSIWNDFTPNVASEALERSSWILDSDHCFSSKSRENCFFWNVKSYSCIYLEWILFQKRGYRGIRQKQLNFWYRSLVQFKVSWKYDFFQMSKAIPVSIWNEFSSKNMTT